MRAGRWRSDSDRRPRIALTATVLWIAFTIVAYFAAPRFVPQPIQWFVGAVHALVAFIAAHAAVREYAGRYNLIRLGPRHKFHLATCAGLLAATAVAVWWLSSAAPILPG